MKTIFLTDEVMVSDPCYDVPTWCHHKLTEVLPGNYYPFNRSVESSIGWGVRNSLLCVIHEDYKSHSLPWEYMSDVTIGVDSGQAGIFSTRTYRNDKHVESSERPEPTGKNGCSWFYNVDGFIEKDGDVFYDLMCGLTINNEDGWGTYDEGVVSRSGYGDGSYDLYVSKNEEGKIIGILIDFGVEESVDIEFNFYLNE